MTRLTRRGALTAAGAVGAGLLGLQTGALAQEEEEESRIVCFGDSITAGSGATPGASKTYPDRLANRIDQSGALDKSVINAGINGNRLLNDSIEDYSFGDSGLSRLDRNALDRPGVTDLILLEGVNDIVHSEADWWDAEAVTAQELIDGMTEVVERCHDADVRALGGTITPFGNYELYGETPEQKRTTVNEWIRESGTFDAVIDFAAILEHPSDPTVLASKYDSGDGLHPNDQGYRAMAFDFQLDALVEGDLETSTPTTNATVTATAQSTTAADGASTTGDAAGDPTTAGNGDGGGGSIPGFGVPAAIAGLGASAAAASGLLRDGDGE